MNRTWIQVLFVTMCILVLSACGKTVEEKATAGIENAESVFTSDPNETNKAIGHIELYLPSGFNIEKGIDESNYTVVNGKDSYILFVNPNETEDSQLHYDLIKNDAKNNIIQDKTFEKEGVFGFSAVNQKDEETFELVVSVGGVKISTISNEKKIDEKLLNMMQMAKSVKVVR